MSASTSVKSVTSTKLLPWRSSRVALKPSDRQRIENGCVVDESAPDSMTIITRSGISGRDHVFRAARDSVLQQDYSHIHHLISTQNATCGYLPTWRAEPPPQCRVRTQIVQARQVPPSAFNAEKLCPYNIFLHDLMDKVRPRSWIMIVDDDALLKSPHHVSNVMRYAARAPTNSILLQPSRVGLNSSTQPRGFQGEAIWPMLPGPRWTRGTKDQLYLRVDMSNLVFHKDMVEHIDVGYSCGADKKIFAQLLKGGGQAIVLESDDVGVGVWGNVHGSARGRTVVGLSWREIGANHPEGGTEIVNPELSKRLSQGKRDFSTRDMTRMGFNNLRVHNYVRAGQAYFQPAEAEKGAPLQRPASGCTQPRKLRTTVKPK